MKRPKAKAPRSKQPKLGYERLEVRLVLDGSTLPTWDQMPEGVGQALTLDGGWTATANAQFGDWTYTSAGNAVTIIGYTGEGGAVEIPGQIEGLPVNAMGAGWFTWKTSPTSVTIPASVTTISDGVFFLDCDRLSAIAVDEANPAYASVDGILYDKPVSMLIQCPPAKAGSASIPASVTGIGFGAFSFCSSLTSILIPAKVTSIGGWAFKYCTSLTEITVPASVVSVGDNVFAHCTLLSSVSVDPSNPVYAAVDGVLYDKALSTLIQWPKGKTGAASMPASVTTIGSYGFFDCSGVTSVTFPVGVTSIDNTAFWNCTALESVYLSASPPVLVSSSPGYSNFSSTPSTVFRLASATGWSSTFGGRPVEVFQPINVAAGQSTTASIAAETSRVLKQGAGTVILASFSTHAGGTVVETGEIVVSHKDALGTGLLEVQAGAKATFQTGYDTVSVTSLSLANTARLEVGTSKLAVAANGFTESDIRAKLIAGRNAGSWDGATGITSAFAGGDRAIGYRVNDGALEVAYAAPGDSNLDGVIDIFDLSEIVSAGKFNTGGSANWTQGDTNYDGVFDIFDLSAVLGTGLFNQGGYRTKGSASSTAADTGRVAPFHPALVFAALAIDSGEQPTTTKRKSV